MGWNILWRKTVILGLLFLLLSNFLSSEEGVPLDIGSYQPSFHPGARSAQRTRDLPIGSEIQSIRQFHGGPEALPAFYSENPVVEANFKRILRSPEDQLRIRRALERAKPYEYFIRKRIEEAGLPPEIFFLPIVESTFNPFALSHRGALGLWQFMENSMYPWMIRNQWVDERRDFWKSTIGALEKLSRNYRVTQDWLLALAAYNTGLNRVRSVMRRNPGKDFWELSQRRLLPRETRAFVPRFLAVARFASYLGRRGIPLDWEPPIEWVQIQLSHSVDLRVVARKGQIPLETLLVGNRELNFPVTPPYPYALKVPRQYEETIRTLLEQGKDQLINFIVHTVRHGDTLYDLSRHYGPPMSMIIEYNPQINPRALRIGAQILLPKLKDVGPFVRHQTPTTELQADGPFSNTYVVRGGDNLWNIARAFRTTVERLAEENKKDPNRPIHPGTILKVP